jgi:peptidoglycan/LPS O-acetylase OafA/YrhL
LKYRSEIDGLRALAVIPVILYHGGLNLFSGGYIGVDVFFVISGYLITTILVEDIKNQSFSISGFYLRRARRILPALFFMMIVCIPFAWTWMLPNELEFFSRTLIAVSFFVSNIFFWREKTNYFGGNVEENPLIHTWSLAVEEQFYIFFPIFLFLFWRFGRHKLFYIICLIALVSLLLNEWTVRNDEKQANFYLIVTRAWELLAGVITALIAEKRGIKKNEFLSSLGLVAIILSIIVFNKNTPIPSIYALLPVLGTMFILLCATKETFVAKLLSTKVFVGIGLISYSAYIWHQPIFAFVKIKLFESPSIHVSIIILLASMVIGLLSWKYIEQPFRKKTNFSGKQILNFSLCLIIFFSTVGFIGYKKNGFPNRFEFTLPQSPIKGNSCHNYLKAEDCLKRKTNKPNIFVLGDSHGSQAYTAIKYALRKSDNFKDNFEIHYHSNKNSNSFPYQLFNLQNLSIENDKTLRALLKNLRDDDLLIISIYSKKIENNEISINFEKNMKKFLKILEPKKIKIILQLNNPRLPYSKWINCYDQFKKNQLSKCAVSKSEYLSQIEQLKMIYGKLCNKKKSCNVFAIENLYFKDSEWFEPMKNFSYVDDNHLSGKELNRLGLFYIEYLNKIGFMR